MRSRASSILAAAALLSSFAASGSAQDAAADSVLRALEASGRKLETMRARFVETKLLTLLDETEESTGEVLLEVPGRLRWNYEQPNESVMVIEDGRFARYFPRTKQVFRGEARGQADLLVGFGPGASNLGKKYEVTVVGEEKVGDIDTHVLDLKPRKQDSLFSEIRLWVDQTRHIPVQTRLMEPTGDHTTIRFDAVALNEGHPKKAFDLDLPKDVTEITR